MKGLNSILSKFPTDCYSVFSDSMNRIVHASGLLVTLYKAQLKNHGYQTANIVSFVDIWDSFLYIQTMLILRREKCHRKKWDFNLWVFRKFASQHAGSRARRLKTIFKRISCCECMSSCAIIWNNSVWALGTALSFTISLIFHGNLAVLCVLRLHIVLRLQGTSLSNSSVDDICCVFNTMLLGMTELVTVFMICHSWGILVKTCWYDDRSITYTFRM